jgi:uncharacterized membrane protein
MRKAFGLITAIMFIVLVATIGALALSFSTQTNKQVVDVYLRAQAELLLRSATEYALLAISGNDRTIKCLNKVEAKYQDFDISVKIQYIIATGKTYNGCDILADNIQTENSDVTVLLDTIVEIPKGKIGMNSEPIRLHRRTLQKP